MEKATRIRLNKIRLTHCLHFAELRLFAGKKLPLKSSILFHSCIYKKGIKLGDCKVNPKIQNLNEKSRQLKFISILVFHVWFFNNFKKIGSK